MMWRCFVALSRASSVRAVAGLPEVSEIPCKGAASGHAGSLPGKLERLLAATVGGCARRLLAQRLELQDKRAAGPAVLGGRVQVPLSLGGVLETTSDSLRLRQRISAPQWIRSAAPRHVRQYAAGRARAFGAARARDPQRRTRRLGDEPPRAAEGPTGASSRTATASGLHTLRASQLARIAARACCWFESCERAHAPRQPRLEPSQYVGGLSRRLRLVGQDSNQQQALISLSKQSARGGARGPRPSVH